MLGTQNHNVFRQDTIPDRQLDVIEPENATKIIVDIYDIFSMSPQTLQGADRLSAHTGAIVLVPDFFDGKRLSADVIPTDTEEKKQQLQEFFSSVASFDINLPKLLAIRKAISVRFPKPEDHCGVFGLCWGGKMAVLACGDGNEGAGRRFNASGTAHPG